MHCDICYLAFYPTTGANFFLHGNKKKHQAIQLFLPYRTAVQLALREFQGFLFITEKRIRARSYLFRSLDQLAQIKRVFPFSRIIPLTYLHSINNHKLILRTQIRKKIHCRFFPAYCHKSRSSNFFLSFADEYKSW